MADPRLVSPNPQTFSTVEKRTLGFRFHKRCIPPQTPSNPTSSLTRDDGLVVGIPNPSIDATDPKIVDQLIDFTQLATGHTYTLSIVAQLDASTIDELVLTLNVVTP